MTDSPRPIRLGVISFAHGHVSPLLQRDRLITMTPRSSPPGTTILSVVGRTLPSSDWNGCPSSIRCWQRDDIDAVFVTSPTNRHAEHVIAAAEAGKHCPAAEADGADAGRLRCHHRRH